MLYVVSVGSWESSWKCMWQQFEGEISGQCAEWLLPVQISSTSTSTNWLHRR